MKDRKHIEQNFHSVAKVMPGVGLRDARESKILAWGFAMAPHRLRALVLHLISRSFGIFQIIVICLKPHYEVYIVL